MLQKKHSCRGCFERCFTDVGIGDFFVKYFIPDVFELSLRDDFAGFHENAAGKMSPTGSEAIRFPAKIGVKFRQTNRT